MSSAAAPGDGGDDIVADLMQDFPAPLNRLLVELYEYNRQAWLSGPMAHTIDATFVRDTGLTPHQLDWAMGVAEQMGGDHPAFVDDDVDRLPEAGPEEIVSDTSVEDVFGGDLR